MPQESNIYQETAHDRTGTLPRWAVPVAVVFLLAGGGVFWNVTTHATGREAPVFPALPAAADRASEQRFLTTLEALPAAQRHEYCLSHTSDVAAIKTDHALHTRFVKLMRGR